jgi:hypothetical protein
MIQITAEEKNPEEGCLYPNIQRQATESIHFISCLKLILLFEKDVEYVITEEGK